MRVSVDGAVGDVRGRHNRGERRQLWSAVRLVGTVRRHLDRWPSRLSLSSAACRQFSSSTHWSDTRQNCVIITFAKWSHVFIAVCVSVCLSVCLPVCKICPKVMNGFWWNILEALGPIIYILLATLISFPCVLYVLRTIPYCLTWQFSRKPR